VSFTLLPLFPRGKTPPPLPIGQEAGVCPRTGLDKVEKREFLPPPGLKLRPLRRPARNQSPYRLSYPGSLFYEISNDNRKIYTGD
jgi:hypothetical protein